VRQLVAWLFGRLHFAPALVSQHQVERIMSNEVKAEDDLQPVIDRMRAAGQEESSKLRQEGNHEGAEWAKTVATPKQLNRLQMALGGAANDADAYAGTTMFRDHREPADRIAADICGDNGAGFWEEAVGVGVDDVNDSDFLAGFVEGALAVWRAVEPRL
jgi:hypothetical protein